MPDWLKILIPSALGLLTTVAAAYFSARWATRRAFQERWWEHQERAYVEIIEALYTIIRYAELCANEPAMRGAEHPRKKEFGERYSKAYWEIQRATDIGAFAISEKAANVLTELRKRPKLDWEDNPPWEVFEEEARNYRDALASIRRCAREDLKK
jgi:hypothetical protein